MSSVIQLLTESEMRGDLLQSGSDPTPTAVEIYRLVCGAAERQGCLGSSDAVGLTVPDVVGLDQGSAEAAIVAAGLTVGAVSTQNSDTIPTGNVINQDPVRGTDVAPGTAVNLVVSLGPKAQDPIQDLTARPKSGKVSLTWSPVAGATGYIVYRSTTPGGPYGQIAAGHQNDFATYLDSTVNDRTTYYYVVTWLSDGRESAASKEAAETPAGRGSNACDGLSLASQPDRAGT